MSEKILVKIPEREFLDVETLEFLDIDPGEELLDALKDAEIQAAHVRAEGYSQWFKALVLEILKRLKDHTAITQAQFLSDGEDFFLVFELRGDHESA